MSVVAGKLSIAGGTVYCLDPANSRSGVAAYGGDEVYDLGIGGTLYTFHVFKTPGNYTFYPNQALTAQVLVVGGGGGGGKDMGGGGGGGGVIYNASYALSAGTSVSVTVGDGGYGSPAAGGGYRPDGVGPENTYHAFTISATSGVNSVFGTITAGGGGYGGSSYFDYTPNNGYGGNAVNGGSAGGASGYSNTTTGRGGTATGGGYAGGGSSGQYYSGGGGGAGGAGTSGPSQANGGAGVANSIFGTTYYFGGGGGGAAYTLSVGGNGGIGGGGAGAVGVTTGGGSALNTGGVGAPVGGGQWGNGRGGDGGANTGGGGGGGSHYNGTNMGGKGGSGIVVVRYPKPASIAPSAYINSGLTSNTPSKMNNGVAYSTSNYGMITFDGVDDFIDFYAPGLGTTTTVEVWANIKDFNKATDGSILFGWGGHLLWLRLGAMGFNTTSGDLYGIPSATVTANGLLNTWKHYVFEMRSDVSYTNNKIYINGTLQGLSQVQGAENAANRTFNGGTGRIGTSASLGSSYSPSMDLGMFKVYNRSLSQNEISASFQTHRYRYGV